MPDESGVPTEAGVATPEQSCSTTLRYDRALRRCAIRSCSTVMVCDVAQPHQRSPKLVAHASGHEARSTVIGVAWPCAAQPAASAPIVYRTQVRPRQPQCTSGAPKSPAASHIDRTSLAALACRCSRLGHAVQLSYSHAPKPATPSDGSAGIACRLGRAQGRQPRERRRTAQAPASRLDRQ